jgi:hypothetical protein
LISSRYATAAPTRAAQIRILSQIRAGIRNRGALTRIRRPVRKSNPHCVQMTASPATTAPHPEHRRLPDPPFRSRSFDDVSSPAEAAPAGGAPATRTGASHRGQRTWLPLLIPDPKAISSPHSQVWRRSPLRMKAVEWHPVHSIDAPA